MRVYQNVWGERFNCGTVELQQGQVFWVEEFDKSRNRIDAMMFAP